MAARLARDTAEPARAAGLGRLRGGGPRARPVDAPNVPEQRVPERVVLVAIGETLVSPTMPVLANDLAPDSLRGRYNGAFTLAWTTGFFVGPAVAGFAFAAGLEEVLLMGLIAACALAAIGASRLERRLPHQVNVVGSAA